MRKRRENVQLSIRLSPLRLCRSRLNAMLPLAASVTEALVHTSLCGPLSIQCYKFAQPVITLWSLAHCTSQLQPPPDSSELCSPPVLPALRPVETGLAVVFDMLMPLCNLSIDAKYLPERSRKQPDERTSLWPPVSDHLTAS